MHSLAMFSLRRLPLARPAALRQFHSTPRLLVKKGDSLPDVELHEGSPGTKVSLAKELKGNGVIIGMGQPHTGLPYQASRRNIR